jgi:uncharacterized protein
MTTLDTRPEGVRDPESNATWRPLGWRHALALNLGPAAITFLAALALAPLMGRLGLPRDFSIAVAFALVLTPIELGLLLRAAHRATGRWSLRALPAVLAYRRPLGRWILLVPVLFGLALALAAAYSPVSNAIGGVLAGIYPHWLLPSSNPATGFSKVVLVSTLLATLAIDGVINPTVEELYFRGYLLPRLPVAGWRAIPVSAALFSLQHYWQPWNWLLIFVLELILTTLVVRLRCLRLGIVMHILANSFGILATLFGVLT